MDCVGLKWKWSWRITIRFMPRFRWQTENASTISAQTLRLEMIIVWCNIYFHLIHWLNNIVNWVSERERELQSCGNNEKASNNRPESEVREWPMQVCSSQISETDFIALLLLELRGNRLIVFIEGNERQSTTKQTRLLRRRRWWCNRSKEIPKQWQTRSFYRRGFCFGDLIFQGDHHELRHLKG